MSNDPLGGLRKLFAPRSVPLVTGPRVGNGRRYSRDAADVALTMAQLSFSDLAPHRLLVGPEIQVYVNDVLMMPWPRWRNGWQWPVIVEIVPGLTPDTGTAEFRSGRMYVRGVESEIIVLHELAHSLVPPNTPPHGEVFISAFLELIEHVMNPAAAETLRGCLAREGITA